MSKRTQAKRDLRKAARKAAKKLKMLQKSQAEKRGTGVISASKVTSKVCGSPSGGRDAQIRFAKTRRCKSRNQERKKFKEENLDWKNSQLKMWPLPQIVQKPVAVLDITKESVKQVA